jgi:hypothetical protein
MGEVEVHSPSVRVGADRRSGSGWTMGVRGWAAQAVNVTAVALICLMFYQDRHEALKAATEDRNLYREELKAERAARAAEIATLNQTIGENTSAVKDLVREFRKHAP